MIDFDNVYATCGSDKKVLEMFFNVMRNRKERRPREPKGRAEDGSYCPKRKAGQSWSYTKDKSEKEEEED